MAENITSFQMYLATCTGNTNNTVYSVPFNISSAEDLAAACRKDHVCTEFQGNRRSSDNFIRCHAVMADCDNEKTDDPAAWITPTTVAERLPGVAFYAVKSRNCDKVKHPGEPGEKGPRPRWHYYFPLRVAIPDIHIIRKIMARILIVFPEFDRDGMKPAQFFFGHAAPVAEYHPGENDIAEYIINHPEIVADDPPADDEPAEPPERNRLDPGSESEFISMNAPDMLAVIPADDYGTWINIGMALKAAGEDVSLWDEWSKGSSKYPGYNGIVKKWNSFRNGKITAGTLVHIAEENGWKPDPEKLTGEAKQNHEQKVYEEKQLKQYREAHREEHAAQLAALGIDCAGDPYRFTWTLDFDGSIDEVTEKATGEIMYKKPTLPAADQHQPIPGKTVITTPGAKEPEKTDSATEKEDKITYRDLVLDLKDAAQIRQFGKALYRIVDGKYYKLLGDIFINYELITVRGMAPEKQKAAQTMIRSLQKEEYVDYDSYYVGFKNGIMNWRTTEFLPYGTKDIPIFKYIDVNYNPEADTTYINGIVSDWCQGDNDKKEMLYELAGCCVYSDIPIKKWWAIEGKADTGKTTYLKLLRAIIGKDNIGNTPIQNLKDSNAIAELIDKSVNIVDDGSGKFATDLSYLRRIIQGDDIQVKLLYQNRFSVKLESRMLFVFNRIPRFRDDNDATAKKMMVIGFNRVYSDEEKDTKLIEKLTTEENKEAFLCLAVDRMKKVINRNITFTVSEESKRITTQIIEDSDQFVSFVSDTISEDYGWKQFLSGKRTSDVYDEFRAWAIAEGYTSPMVRKQFTERCCKESGAYIRSSHGNRFYAFME